MGLRRISINDLQWHHRGVDIAPRDLFPNPVIVSDYQMERAVNAKPTDPAAYRIPKRKWIGKDAVMKIFARLRQLLKIGSRFHASRYDVDQMPAMRYMYPGQRLVFGKKREPHVNRSGNVSVENFILLLQQFPGNAEIVFMMDEKPMRLLAVPSADAAKKLPFIYFDLGMP